MIELKPVPVRDLAPDEGPEAWHSTGHDAHFLLQFPRGVSQLGAGWVRVDFEIDFPDGALRPRLYWDQGDGFAERNSLLLPYPEGGRIRHLFRLPAAARALRLDPAEREARFALRRLRIGRTNRLAALVGTLAPYAGRAFASPRLYLSFLADLAELWWRAGSSAVRGAVRELLVTQEAAAMRALVKAQLNAARRSGSMAVVRRGAGLGGDKLLRLRRDGGRQRIGIGLVEHFGDIIACEPVARHLRSAYPDAEICWVVREPFRELIDANPYIDHTIAVDCLTDWIKWRAHGVFDRIVDLHVNQRICQHCGIALRKWEGNPDITGDNHFHYGGLLQAFCIGAGLPPLDQAPAVYITAAATEEVDGWDLPARYAVFHCRSNAAEKDWQYGKWTGLAQRVARAAGIGIVEVGLVPTIVDPAAGAIDLCGRTTILQMAEVIRRAVIFVGVDSGPAHIANAVGTPGVVLLGHFGAFKNYNPFSGDYGSGRNVGLVRNADGPAALLSEDQVFAAVTEQLAAGAAGRAPARQPAQAALPDLQSQPVTRHTEPRLIAFYLPQYHPIPLNDQAWGKGFTEWRNVGKARPFFDGQYQPRLPGELGYYDLRVPEIMDQQAELAREHGIDGFCYYLYWFNGTRLLHLPIDNMLRRRKPDFPFCFCWANENWTRRWDGMEKEILIGQKHTPEDDLDFIRHLMPAFEDPRYLRVNGKPLLLVYRTELFPDPGATAERWRDETTRAGIGDLYLVRCEGFDPWTDPRTIGFDASYEVPTFILPDELKVADPGSLRVASDFRGRIYDYAKIVDWYCARPDTEYRRYRGPMAAWDNTPRHGSNAVVFHGVTPASFRRWLADALAHARRRYAGEERLVFINAWNEWAEGSYLEPDLRYGRQFLEAVKSAVSASAAAPGAAPRPAHVPAADGPAPSLERTIADR